MERTATVNKTETFYSASAGLTFYPKPSERVIEGGSSKVVDPNPVQFNPIGDGFGRFVTNKPELIEALKRRLKTVGDVFRGDEYIKRTTPAEIQVSEAMRVIKTKNRLIADLEREKVELQTQLSRGVKPGGASSAPKK